MAVRLTLFAHGSCRAVDNCTLSLKWSFQWLVKLSGQARPPTD
ncbi:hypothetical protein F638_1461 [Pseudomonas sp. LAIL14HWK12:I2]|jgi:hypothetical protein|nr:hypothetical protein [Pseudomonas sp. LAIL14HWK12:I2]TFA85210.1 hypothetical protein F638_1461 [Pseudomonas sp. LAIL14HWK12:I2]